MASHLAGKKKSIKKKKYQGGRAGLKGDPNAQGIEGRTPEYGRGSGHAWNLRSEEVLKRE